MSAWTLEHHDAVAVLTFTRAPRNTMDFASMTELGDHLERIAARRDETAAVVLTGGPDGQFVAHADIEELIAWGDGTIPREAIRAWDRTIALLEDIPQITVAAIDGQAWGGGLEIALACDLRIASPRADLGQPEVRVGVIPGAGATVRLPRLIGYAKAAELVLTARTLDADEARALGLLAAVLPTPDFRRSAVDWARRLTRHEPAALFAAKQALLHGLRTDAPTALRRERELFGELAATSRALRQWVPPAAPSHGET